MIANGAKNGTFQVDYLNDAVKEFGIRVKDGTADDAFKTLGLNVDDLKTKFAQGGEGEKEAFQIVNTALFSCDMKCKETFWAWHCTEPSGKIWEKMPCVPW